MVPEAVTEIGEGNVSTGPVPSVTVTVNEPVEAFPAASDDEHETVVTPMGNDEPEAGVQTTGRAPSTASSAEALKVTTALVPEAVTAIGEGSVSTGPVPSVTVTVNEPVEVLPVASDDVQVTVVTPTGNDEPEAGVQTTGRAPSTASSAEALKVTRRRWCRRPSQRSARAA